MGLSYLLGAGGCSGGDKPTGRSHPAGTGTGVPHAQARRIAAEYRGAEAFLPRSVPAGFAFSRWWTASDCGPCGLRLVVHFAHARGGLRWETFFPEDPSRRRLDCRHQPRVAAVIDGRKVSYRRLGGTETAWFCVPHRYHETVSVSHRVSRGDGVTARDLERMVASARPQPPGRARGSRHELPARATALSMGRAFGPPFFLPRSLPRGFVFTRWTVRPAGFDLEPRRTLRATFGRDGVLLEWTILAGVDKYGDDCPRHGKPLAAMHTFASHGQRISFGAGIHGATAWRCLPRHAVGNKRPLEVELWYDINLDSNKMRRRAVRMVATARLFHP